jgi:lipopolysaccharide assembly protein A
MRIGLILLVLLFAGAGALFGALNNQTITLDFYFVSIELAKGGALLCALVAGWLLGGVLVYLSLVVPLRGRVRRLTRKNRQQEAAAAEAAASADKPAAESRP